tara:strand:+ start:928 stop:1374 length:447 start_codon:yes stop_codon:yes gene_type:complete
MFKLLSNLNNCIRWDAPAQAGEWPLISGVTGSLVSFDATGCELPTAGDVAVATIWSEGNRDGSAGFSPDIVDNGKLTLIAGGYRALTDNFTGTINPGQSVKVGSAGNLVADAAGTAASIGYCTKSGVSVSKSVNGVQSTVTCIEVVIY